MPLMRRRLMRRPEPDADAPTLATLIRAIDDEIEHHLDLIEQELLSKGVPGPEARRRAIERFGDPTELRTQAIRDHAEQRPRHRNHLTLAASAAAAAIAVAGLSLSLAGWRNAERRVQQLSAQIESVGSSLAAVRGGALVPLAQNVGFVTVEGDVQDPRLWTIPRGGQVTLRQILARAGGISPGARGSVTVTELKSGEVVGVSEYSIERLVSPTDPADLLLDGFFHVLVTHDRDPAPRSTLRD